MTALERSSGVSGESNESMAGVISVSGAAVYGGAA